MNRECRLSLGPALFEKTWRSSLYERCVMIKLSSKPSNSLMIAWLAANLRQYMCFWIQERLIFLFIFLFFKKVH